MLVYKTTSGWKIQVAEKYFLLPEEHWNGWMNNSIDIPAVKSLANTYQPTHAPSPEELLAPIQQQELWACGVTYLRSKEGRREESAPSGGADFYSKVYEAERPEVFFKANPTRIAGPGAKVRIRKDSNWNVPEPECTLVVNATGKIIGYTIGNDMSSRSIEGENPLYLPQAKTYDGCAALGPCIWISEEKIAPETIISMKIFRAKTFVFSGEVKWQQMKRTPESLVSFVYRECSFPNGCYIMTGTGIVPPKDFSLLSGDSIHITIPPMGTLFNNVA
jgi:2-dehydro-3-deoxy-D-arabinonate dehydratase